MPLTASSLSRACRSIADYLASELRASARSINVVIGSPHDAADIPGNNAHRLNLFFYRFEPGGFQAGVTPDEPWLLRLHCLVTAFSTEENNRTAGENDLRILGEVMRVLHERPVLDPIMIEGDTVRLHAIYEPLTLDDLNHLWSIQGDTSFRPSLSYELALAPVFPSELGLGAPLVGFMGVDARPMTLVTEPSSGDVRAPVVSPVAVDTRRADWSPHICLVIDDACTHAVSLEIGSDELAGFTPQVWIAGVPGEEVELAWDVWTSADGWTSLPAVSSATVTDDAIDPVRAADATTVEVPLPFNDHAGQAVLYCRRTWTRPDGSEIPLRSNPVVISLYEAAS